LPDIEQAIYVCLERSIETMKHLPTFRQLRYLVAVAEHRHFGRAADDCAVTQSTLSAGIRELEATLGVTLIGRSTRRAALTPLGEEIVARARVLLLGAEDLVDAAQAGRRPLTGLLRLGVIPTIGPYLLPRAMPDARRSYPELRLYLREERTATLLDLLGKGRLDAAVLALPYDIGPLRSAVLGEDRLLVACPRTHPFAGRAGITVGELQGERLLLLEDGHCLREHALAECRLLPGQANEDFQGTSLGTLIQMVAGGLGLTLLPAIAADVETAREPDIAVVPLSDARPARQIALCWPAGSPRGAELQLLAALLRRQLPPAGAADDDGDTPAAGSDARVGARIGAGSGAGRVD
jgi:LysR family hydrogen peroxide-inducible transcriptional activator